MSKLIDASRVTIKVGDYGIAPAAALVDQRLLQRTQAYRRMAGVRMMALDKTGMHKHIPGGNYHISRKIDGEFTVLVYQDGDVLTLNPGGTVRQGLPFMEEVAKLFKAAKVKQAMVAGELYVNRTDKRPRVHDVSRVARNPENQAALESLHFAAFDLMELDEADPSADFDETWKTLKTLFAKGEKAHVVEAIDSGDTKLLAKTYEEWVEGEGAEGLVARSDEGGTFKVKPRHSIDVVVLGFAEGIDDRAGMLHDLLLGIMRKDGSFQVCGRVGGGFSDQDRIDFLSDLKDMVVESEYAEVNSDHVAYQMVKPEWVIEISCLDLISQTTRGANINRMVIQWDAKKSTWETLRRLPLVSIISPQFVRKREDKSVNPDDLRIAQFTDLVEIQQAEKGAEDLAMPKSTLIKRVVGTKEAKGKTMVRKVLLWKTNKDTETDDFPAYVLYQTDFSPNRATPLKRDIRVSSSKEQLETMFSEMEAKCFVRGWTVQE